MSISKGSGRMRRDLFTRKKYKLRESEAGCQVVCISDDVRALDAGGNWRMRSLWIARRKDVGRVLDAYLWFQYVMRKLFRVLSECYTFRGGMYNPLPERLVTARQAHGRMPPPQARALNDVLRLFDSPQLKVHQTIASVMSTPRKSAFNLQTCARPNILALEPYRCAREYVHISPAFSLPVR